MPSTHLAGSLLDQPAAAVVRRVAEDGLHVASDAIDALARARARLRRSDTPKRRRREAKAVHDLRVVLRRMLGWFEVAAPVIGAPPRRRDVRPWRRLARRAGRVRDLHVLADWLGEVEATSSAHEAAEALAAECARALRKGGRRLARQLDAVGARERRAVLRWLRAAPRQRRAHRATFAEAMAAALRERDDALGAAIADWSAHDGPEAAHAVRIAVKQLRYLLEHLEPDVPEAEAPRRALEAVQEELGRLHDAQVRLARVRDAGSAALVARARRDLARCERTAHAAAGTRALAMPRTAARRIARSLGARARGARETRER